MLPRVLLCQQQPWKFKLQRKKSEYDQFFQLGSFDAECNDVVLLRKEMPKDQCMVQHGQLWP